MRIDNLINSNIELEVKKKGQKNNPKSRNRTGDISVIEIKLQPSAIAN